MSARNGKRRSRQKRAYETESRLTRLETQVENCVTDAGMASALGELRDEVHKALRAQDQKTIRILWGVLLSLIATVVGVVLAAILT